MNIRSDQPLSFARRGEGSPVVLVHGLGSSGDDWALQQAALVRGHHVVALDLPGHGRSPAPPGPLTMRGLAEGVRDLIDRLVGTDVHVVGLSLGGMVALQLAVDSPDRVRSLSIINSGPEVVPRRPREHVAIWTRRAMTRFCSMQRLGRSLAPRLFPHPHQQRLRDAFTERFARNHKPSYEAAFDAIVGWTVMDRVGAIRCPTLVVSGDRDYTTPARKAEYVRRMPDARMVVIEDSGHATPLDQPEALNRVLVDFLAEVDGRGELEALGGAA